MQYPDKTHVTYCEHMQHPDKHTCKHTSEKTDEIFRIDTCNIHVQPLQYIQHLNLVLQHQYEVLAIYL
jgi:hypothetical protein